jgi:hypothetical protein
VNRAVRLAAVLLPLAGLAALWGMSDRTYREGTDWDVPVAGYDPRDILRGHYVEFEYDWPGLDEQRFGLPLDRLCLAGAAPAISRAEPVADDAALAACPHPLRANPAGVYGQESLRRGRLYVGQDRARQLGETLRKQDQRGIVTIRQRDDGTITPLAIRFRPLTAEEAAARRAQRERAEELLPPPAAISR